MALQCTGKILSHENRVAWEYNEELQGSLGLIKGMHANLIAGPYSKMMYSKSQWIKKWVLSTSTKIICCNKFCARMRSRLCWDPWTGCKDYQIYEYCEGLMVILEEEEPTREKKTKMTIHFIVIQKLLSTNVHLGRQVVAHHFKVYIFGSRNGIGIIDFNKTLICL